MTDREVHELKPGDVVYLAYVQPGLGTVEVRCIPTSVRAVEHDTIVTLHFHGRPGIEISHNGGCMVSAARCHRTPGAAHADIRRLLDDRIRALEVERSKW